MGLFHVGCQQHCACELGTKPANSIMSLQQAAHHHDSIMREGMSQAVVNIIRVLVQAIFVVRHLVVY